MNSFSHFRAINMTMWALMDRVRILDQHPAYIVLKICQTRIYSTTRKRFMYCDIRLYLIILWLLYCICCVLYLVMKYWHVGNSTGKRDRLWNGVYFSFMDRILMSVVKRSIHRSKLRIYPGLPTSTTQTLIVVQYVYMTTCSNISLWLSCTY